jgi:hypothetical protein
VLVTSYSTQPVVSEGAAVVGIAPGPASPWCPCPSPIRVVSGGTVAGGLRRVTTAQTPPAPYCVSPLDRRRSCARGLAELSPWLRALGYLLRSRARASVLPALRTSVLRGSEGPGDRASTARAQGPAGWGDVICLGPRRQPARQALQVFVTVNSPSVKPRSGQPGAGAPLGARTGRLPVRRTGTTSVFMATRCLLTLKRLRSGQRTRPAQTPGPSLSGAVARRCGFIPAGPDSAAEYLMPTMAIINSAVAHCGGLGGSALASGIAGAGRVH